MCSLDEDGIRLRSVSIKGVMGGDVYLCIY